MVVDYGSTPPPSATSATTGAPSSTGSTLFGGPAQPPSANNPTAYAAYMASVDASHTGMQGTSTPTRPVTLAETVHTLGPDSALLQFGSTASASTPAPLSTSAAPAPTSLAKAPSSAPVLANPNIIGSPTGTTLDSANHFYFGNYAGSPVSTGGVVPLAWGNGQPLTQSQTTYETGLFNANNGIPLTGAEKAQLLSPPSGSPGTIGSLLTGQISSYLSSKNPAITVSNAPYFSPFGPQTQQQAYNTLPAAQQQSVVQQALLQRLQQLGFNNTAIYQQQLAGELQRLQQQQTKSQAMFSGQKASGPYDFFFQDQFSSKPEKTTQTTQIQQMNLLNSMPSSLLLNQELNSQSEASQTQQGIFSSQIGANLQNEVPYNLANSYLQTQINKYLQNPTLNGAINLGNGQFFNPTYAALRLAQISLNSPALLQNLAAALGNGAAAIPNFLLGTNLKPAIAPTNAANPVVSYLADTYPQNFGYAASYPLTLLGGLKIPYISQGAGEISPYISALAATLPQSAASLVSPNQTPLGTAGNLIYLGTSAAAPGASALYGFGTAGLGAGINYLTGQQTTPQGFAQNYQLGAELAGPFKAAGAVGDLIGAGKTGLGGWLAKGIPTSSLMALLQAGQQAANGNTNPVSLAEAAGLGYAGGTALQALPFLAQPLKDYLNSIKLNTADWNLFPNLRPVENNLRNAFSSLTQGYNIRPIGYDVNGNPIFGRSLENAINIGPNGGLPNTLPVPYSANPFDANLRMQLADLIAKLNPNSGYTQQEINQIIKSNLQNSGNNLPVPYNPTQLNNDANFRMALSDLYNKLNPNSGYTQSEINQIIKSNLNENGALADFLNIKNMYATPPIAPETNPLNNALEQLNTIANNIKYSELGNEQGTPNLARVIANLPPRIDYNPQSGILKTYEAIADPTSPTGFRWQARSAFDLNQISPLTQALSSPPPTRRIPFTSEYSPNFVLVGKPYYPGQTLPQIFRQNPSPMNENDATIATLLKEQFDKLFGKFSSGSKASFGGSPTPPSNPSPSDSFGSGSSGGGPYKVNINSDGTISLLKMSDEQVQEFLKETDQTLTEGIEKGDVASLLAKDQLNQESSKYSVGMIPYLQFLSEKELEAELSKPMTAQQSIAAYSGKSVLMSEGVYWVCWVKGSCAFP